jgi:small subunit ribosomal protein S21
MLVRVQDNNIDKALKQMKRKLQREGVFREMRERQHYMKPSEIRARSRAAAIKRADKSNRKRAEKDSVRPG